MTRTRPVDEGRRSHARGRDGLSLIEVMISLSILALAGLALFGAMNSSMKLSGFSSRLSIATQDLERLTQVILSTPWPPATNGFPHNAGPGASDTATKTTGSLRGVEVTPVIDGTLVASDLIYTLTNQEMWIQYQPITAAGVTGSPGDVGDPLQLKIFVQWEEPGSPGRTMTRSVTTILSNQ